MRAAGAVELFLWYTGLVVSVALVVRIWREGLHTTYRGFFLYLMVDVMQNLAALALRGNRQYYGISYVVFEGAKCFLSVLVVLELYELALKNYRGIATFGRRSVQAVLTLAMAMTAASLWFDLLGSPGDYPLLYWTRVLERTIISTLAIFLLLISAFLAWFPVRLNRNLLRYIAGFVIYFLAKSFTMLTANMLGAHLRGLLSTISLAVYCGLFVFWLFALSEKGEEVPAFFGHRSPPRDEGQLVRQLEAINAALLRSSRK